MKTTRTARVLNVFLASPDDVRNERGIAEELISDLNKIIRSRLGWTIWLHKWEDTTPGFGRPQEIINEAVDGCDLFVGLLWKRWGQPSGKYSSGFEEEYERARSRRKETEAPEIWLVFKAIDDESRKDPGTQLSKVLEFRTTQSTIGEVLYREIRDTSDWQRKLNNWLWDYILKLQSTELLPATPAASNPLAQPPDATPISLGLEMIQAPTQLVDATESLLKIVRSGDIESSAENAEPLDEFQVARLFLLSATWMSRRFTGETTGTHELNPLYKHRERLETTASEENQLFRTLVAAQGDVIPGWYWFRSMTQDILAHSLITLASADPSAEVRASAVKLLRTSHIEIPNQHWSDLPLADDSDAVRFEACAYLGALGDETAINYLEDGVRDDGLFTSPSAKHAKLSIMLRVKPQETFDLLIQSNEYLSEEWLDQLRHIAVGASDATLLKALDHDLEGVRKLAIKELASRSRLTRDEAEKLTKDPSLTIRAAAFQELARQGFLSDFDVVRKALEVDEQPNGRLLALSGLLSPNPKPDADAIILTFFKGQSSESVLQAVDWFWFEGALAYQSLAVDHYQAIRDHLRVDLESGFSRIKGESIERVIARHGPEFATKTVDKFGEVDDYIKSKFTEAALKGLAANGEAADIRFARQYLSNEKSPLRLAAIKIAARFGTPDDVEPLMAVCRDSYGEIREEAGLVALRLSPDPLSIAKELSRSSDGKLSEAAFAWLYTRQPEEVGDFVL